MNHNFSLYDMENPSVINLIRREIDQFEDHKIDNFDMTLPKSSFNGIHHETIDLSKVAKKPNFNECTSLSVNQYGNSKYLDKAQLKTLRKEGKVVVQSVDFQGQEHVWQISPILQKGTKNTQESFYDDLSVGCHQIIVSIPNRIYKGEYFTLLNGVKNIFKAIIDLPVLFVGWTEKRKKYADYEVKMKMEEFTINKFMETILSGANIPSNCYTIETLNGNSIHLILDKKIYIVEKLKLPFNEFKIYWEQTKLDRRKEILKSFNFANDDENIKQSLIVENSLYKKEIDRLIRLNLDNDDAESLINLINNLIIFRTHLDNHTKQKNIDLEAHKEYLRESHYIMCRSDDWMNNQIEDFNTKWFNDHPIEDVYNRISHDLTGQEKYIFDLNRSIETSEEYRLEKEKLENMEVPSRIFVFNFRIWNPKNWKITEKNNYYEANKYNSVELSTSFPGWRLANIAMRTGYMFNNGIFYLLVNFHQGKFGLRSLVGLETFYTGVDINRHTGELESVMPNETWFGRIKLLWENISRSRQEFEDTPDTGILGKSFTRIINVLWNYVIKGGLGTALCFVGHPILVVLNTIVTGLSVITSPLWAPVFAILKYLFDIFIYDFDLPNEHDTGAIGIFRIIFYNLLVKGLGQIGTTLIGIAGHGLISLIVFCWALISNGVRYIYDAGMYHILLKNLAKVPGDDGFLVRRISGPGLGNDYFHLISHKLALVMLQYQLEKMEMDAYAIQMKHRIEKPLEDLLEFYEQFKNVGMVCDHKKSPVKDYTITKEKLKEQLKEMTNEYWNNYNIKKHIDNKHLIKMTNDDLVIAMEIGVGMVQDFVSKQILPRLSINEQMQFWTSKNVIQNDWIGLVKYCYCVLFNNEIMTSIEEVDVNGFHLVAKETNVASFIKDLFDGEPKDGLEYNAINPLTISKLLKLSNETILPTDVFSYQEINKLSIDKTKIKKYKNDIELQHDLSDSTEKHTRLDSYGTI